MIFVKWIVLTEDDNEKKNQLKINKKSENCIEGTGRSIYTVRSCRIERVITPTRNSNFANVHAFWP